MVMGAFLGSGFIGNLPGDIMVKKSIHKAMPNPARYVTLHRVNLRVIESNEKRLRLKTATAC